MIIAEDEARRQAGFVCMIYYKNRYAKGGLSAFSRYCRFGVAGRERRTSDASCGDYRGFASGTETGSAHSAQVKKEEIAPNDAISQKKHCWGLQAIKVRVPKA
jgi:hypothetical protein